MRTGAEVDRLRAAAGQAHAGAEAAAGVVIARKRELDGVVAGREVAERVPAVGTGVRRALLDIVAIDLHDCARDGSVAGRALHDASHRAGRTARAGTEVGGLRLAARHGHASARVAAGLVPGGHGDPDGVGSGRQAAEGVLAVRPGGRRALLNVVGVEDDDRHARDGLALRRALDRPGDAARRAARARAEVDGLRQTARQRHALAGAATRVVAGGDRQLDRVGAGRQAAERVLAVGAGRCGALLDVGSVVDLDDCTRNGLAARLALDDARDLGRRTTRAGAEVDGLRLAARQRHAGAGVSAGLIAGGHRDADAVASGGQVSKRVLAVGAGGRGALLDVAGVEDGDHRTRDSLAARRALDDAADGGRPTGRAHAKVDGRRLAAGERYGRVGGPAGLIAARHHDRDLVGARGQVAERVLAVAAGPRRALLDVVGIVQLDGNAVDRLVRRRALDGAGHAGGRAVGASAEVHGLRLAAGDRDAGTRAAAGLIAAG